MEFKQPYFITKHATERFQKRVENLRHSEILLIIQYLLQEENNPKLIEIGKINYQSAKLYLNYYKGKSVYIPVVNNLGKEWPTVNTIMSEESIIHKKYIRGELMGLYYDPLTTNSIAYILNVDRGTVVDWINRGYLKCVRKPSKNHRSKISWTALQNFMKKYPKLWNAAKMNINPLDYKIKTPWIEEKEKNDKAQKRENLCWQPWEDNILKELYPDNPDKCYKILKRSKTAIRIRACRLRKLGDM